MADIRLLKSEIAVNRTVLSKFGVEIDLDIAKQVLSPKPNTGWTSNTMAVILKI